MHILLLFYDRIILALKLKSDAKTKIRRTRNFWKKTPILIVLFTLYTINKGPSKRVLKKNIFDTVL